MKSRQECHQEIDRHTRETVDKYEQGTPNIEFVCIYMKPTNSLINPKNYQFIIKHEPRIFSITLSQVNSYLLQVLNIALTIHEMTKTPRK